MNNSDVTDNAENETEQKKVTEEDKKKHADQLWATFKKDTNFKSVKTQKPPEKDLADSRPKKIKVTEVLEFAGEKLCVEKEILEESLHSKIISDSNESRFKKVKGGLSSILNQIEKKTKITTLEKSKLDWEKFKKDEDIGDELQSYNKGKHGYV